MINPAFTMDPTREERILKAVRACQEDGLSYQKAANANGVAPSVVWKRAKGLSQSPQRRHAEQQLLTPPQELALERWLLEQYERGFPLTWRGAAAAAACILGPPGEPDYEPGHKWVARYMGRHPNLRMRWSKTVSKARACALTQDHLDNYWDIVPSGSIGGREGIVPDKYQTFVRMQSYSLKASSMSTTSSRRTSMEWMRPE